MIRIVIRALVYLVSAGIGILVAQAVLDDMHVHLGGFVISVVVFAVAQLILGPFIAKFVARNASAFLGGVGLVSTFIALLIASLFGGDGIEINGVATWLAATVIVWVVTAAATLILPWLLVKAGVQRARDEKAATNG